MSKPEPFARALAERQATKSLLHNSGGMSKGREQEHEAKLQRFVEAYRKNGGHRGNAAIAAGAKVTNTASSYAVGMRLYKKAVERGLLSESAAEADRDLDKMDLVKLLSLQASGKRPSKRQEVERWDPKAGRMKIVERRTEWDEGGSQEKLAKVLGVYTDGPKAPTVNILQVLGEMPAEERAKAEAQLIEAHSRLLEAAEVDPTPPAESE